MAITINNFTGTNSKITITDCGQYVPLINSKFTFLEDSEFRCTAQSNNLDSSMLFNYDQEIKIHFIWEYKKEFSCLLDYLYFDIDLPNGVSGHFDIHIDEPDGYPLIGSFEYDGFVTLSSAGYKNYFSTPREPVAAAVTIDLQWIDIDPTVPVSGDDPIIFPLPNIETIVEGYKVGITQGCNYDGLTLHQGIIEPYKPNLFYLNKVVNYTEEILHPTYFSSPGDQILFYGTLLLNTIDDVSSGYPTILQDLVIKLWTVDMVKQFCDYHVLQEYAILNGKEAAYNLDTFLNININNLSTGPYIYYFTVSFPLPSLAIFNKNEQFLHFPLKLAVVPMITTQLTASGEEEEEERFNKPITDIFTGSLRNDTAVNCFNFNTRGTYIYLDPISGYNRCKINSYISFDQIPLDNYGPEIVNQQVVISSSGSTIEQSAYLITLSEADRLSYLNNWYPNGYPASFLLNDPLGDYFLFNIKLHLINNNSDDLNFIKKVWIMLNDLTQYQLFDFYEDSDAGGSNYLNIFDTEYIEDWEPSEYAPYNYINATKMYANRSQLFSSGILEFATGNTVETAENNFNYVGTFGTIYDNVIEADYGPFIKQEHEYKASLIIETDGNISEYSSSETYNIDDIVWYNDNLYLKTQEDTGDNLAPDGPLWTSLNCDSSWPPPYFYEDEASYDQYDVVLDEGVVWFAAEAITNPANDIPGISAKWHYLTTLEFNLALPNLTSTTILHLSQLSTGGLSIGRVGTSTQNHPKFECYYPAKFKQPVEFSGIANFNQPAYFNGGIIGVTTYPLLEAGQTETAEQLTGGTWIDGKPIYRKVYSKSVTLTTSLNFASAPANIDTLIFTHMMADKRGRPIPYTYYSNANWDTNWYLSGSTFVIQAGSSMRAKHHITFIIEYTKTTD